MDAAGLRWGAGLIAFSPIASLFLLVVTRKPELVIISIIGAFCYLVALLLSSILWIIVPPLKETAIYAVLVGVLSQTLMRIALFRMYQRTEIMIKSASHPLFRLPLNDATSSLASGVGFGLMHIVMLFGSVLASSPDDPGVLYEASCRETPLVLVLAFLALAFSLLDLLLTFLTFLYLRRRRWDRLWVMVAIHLAASCTTIINEASNGCIISLPLVYSILIVSLFVCIRENNDVASGSSI